MSSTTTALERMNFVKTEKRSKCCKTVKEAIEKHRFRKCAQINKGRFVDGFILNKIYDINLVGSKKYVVCQYIFQEVKRELEKIKTKGPCKRVKQELISERNQKKRSIVDSMKENYMVIEEYLIDD